MKCKKLIEACEPIKPESICEGVGINELVDKHFCAFNARKFREACQLFTMEVLTSDTRIALSLAGALTPAGMGSSSIVPLIKCNLVDWIVSTGANLYHDLQICLGFDMYKGQHQVDDGELRGDGVVRIYDIFFEATGLYKTDKFIRDTFREYTAGNSHKTILSTADVHNILGNELLRINPNSHEHSILAAAAFMGVPIYTSSPGDSSIGMNLAAINLEETVLTVDPSLDVNETASYVYDIKREGGKSAVVVFGGGSPKNFLLQTEPHIQEVLGLEEYGHDFFIQFTDARPDSGGLSGATPSEAITWGKLDTQMISKTVVCYGDCSVYMPLFVSYILNSNTSRTPRRLLNLRKQCLTRLSEDYRRSKNWKA